MHHPHSLTTLALIALLARPATPAATVTLTNSPAYESQRPCAKKCFYTGFSVDGGPDELASDIGCGTDPIENECFCRGDLQNEALNTLQSCVSDRCDRKDTDIQVALGLYEDYCTSNGYTRDAIPTPTVSSGKSSTTRSTTAVTSSSSSSSTDSAPTTTAATTAQSSTTETASTTSSSADTAETESRGNGGGGGGGSGVDGGEIAGIVVGVLSFIATSAGVWYAHKALKSRKSAAAAAAAATSPT